MNVKFVEQDFDKESFEPIYKFEVNINYELLFMPNIGEGKFTIIGKELVEQMIKKLKEIENL